MSSMCVLVMTDDGIPGCNCPGIPESGEINLGLVA
jgi:hypothetical protein